MALLLLVPCLLLDAWAGATLWRWFLMEPTGFMLTFRAALGVAFLGALWTHQYIPRTKGEEAEAAVLWVFVPPFMVGVAAVLERFVQ